MEMIQCERCGRNYKTKDIVVSVKNGSDISFLCHDCSNLIGLCFTCEKYTTCAFHNDEDPTPKTKTYRRTIQTPMGIMEQRQTVPNGERIKKFCLDGKCPCANEEDPDNPFCCRHTEYKTCSNYKEKDYTLPSNQ